MKHNYGVDNCEAALQIVRLQSTTDCEIAAYSRVGRSVSSVFSQRIITVFLQKRKRGVRLKREREREKYFGRREISVREREEFWRERVERE